MKRIRNDSLRNDFKITKFFSGVVPNNGNGTFSTSSNNSTASATSTLTTHIPLQLQSILSECGQGSHTVTSVTDTCLSDEQNGNNYIGKTPDSPDTISVSSCSGPCCNTSFNHPYREYRDNEFVKTKGKRGFNKEWLVKHIWLIYCPQRDKAFCHYCRLTLHTTLVGKQKPEDAFTITGFQCWKNAAQRFTSHEQSSCHLAAVNTMNYRMGQTHSIDVALLNQMKSDQDTRRMNLMVLISSIKFLARQGVAMQGSPQSEGNLAQLIKLRMADNPKLKNFVDDNKYFSPEIINEILEIMSHTVIRKIIEQVKVYKYYGIIADETRDESDKEQLSICLRWVDGNFNIHEDCIGLYHVIDTSANSLVTMIKDVLLRLGLPLADCLGQGYDGAAQMSGVHKGVAKQIQDDNPLALYVHCLSHSLNLALQDTSNSIRLIRDSLSLVQSIYNLIAKQSVKRQDALKDIASKLENCDSSVTLKKLCPTRFTVREKAINAVLKNYEAIKIACENFESLSGEAGLQSAGINALLSKFDTYIGLSISHEIFSITENLARQLQAEDTTAEIVKSSVDTCVNYLKGLRSNENFDRTFDFIKNKCNMITDSPKLPRVRKVPLRYCHNQDQHCFQSPKEYYRVQYYELLDLVVGCIESRFNQSSMDKLICIERILINSANRNYDNVENEIDLNLSIYETKEILDLALLKLQLKMLSSLIATYNDSHPATAIISVTKVSTIIDVLLSTNTKLMFSQIHSVIRIYLTCPLTSIMAERSFSTLRRLKSYLRTTMGQVRLNSLILMNIHKEYCDNLVAEDICLDFVGRNERRKHYFG